jgi:HPt (histidine-containing phosphotransfer) domain-containing protein
MVGGDRALLKDVLGAFLEESPLLIRELEAALAAGDGARVARAAHTIKGQMRILGCETPYDTAFELELLGRRGDCAPAADVRDRLVSEVRQIVPLVAAWLREA